MIAKTLKETRGDFPFDWANLDSYRDSKAYRKEIYLKNQDGIVDELIIMFFHLFRDSKNNLQVFNKSWWDFCLDTWDFNKEKPNYDLRGKSEETQEYLKMLMESQIHSNYSGCCTCSNWIGFLKIILKCIIEHKAPYSPLFCDVENKYFFYFHHTGSIGFYYKEENNVVEQILLISNQDYLVKD